MKKKQIGLNILFVILSFIIIIPFLTIVSVSFSDEKDIITNGYKLIPEHFSLEAYRYILSSPGAIRNAYKVTAVYSVLATIGGTLLMAMIAYPLSQNAMPARNAVNFILFFTMLFSGGLVPTYLLISKYLHLSDTIWVYVLTVLVNPWYVFMMRTFFRDLPNEIIESALVDGANDYMIFFRFILPLSKPILATIALFVFLEKWNDWYTALLYINDESLVSLQYLLQKIMQNIQLIQTNEFAASNTNISNIPSETVRMAMAIIVAGPAMVIFPFFQKYFVKGLTVGSVKG